VAARLQHVEGDEDRRRAEYGGIRLAEELKPRDELLVEPGDLAVEDERLWAQLRDSGCNLGEAMSMGDAVAGIARPSMPQPRAP